jgi:hypothetical protein
LNWILRRSNFKRLLTYLTNCWPNVSSSLF